MSAHININKHMLIHSYPLPRKEHLRKKSVPLAMLFEFKSHISLFSEVALLSGSSCSDGDRKLPADHRGHTVTMATICRLVRVRQTKHASTTSPVLILLRNKIHLFLPQRSVRENRKRGGLCILWVLRLLGPRGPPLTPWTRPELGSQGSPARSPVLTITALA